MNLPSDIYEYLLLTCHPYQIKNLYYTCKFLYNIVRDKFLLARVSHKWCWPDRILTDILTHIPDLNFPNIWKASLFYFPLYPIHNDYGRCIDSRSVGKFDPIPLYYQTCLNGYGESDCEGFISEIIKNPISLDLSQSISQLMAIVLIASKYKHNHILERLIISLCNIRKGHCIDDWNEETIISISDITSAFCVVISEFMNKSYKITLDNDIDTDMYKYMILRCIRAIRCIKINYPPEQMISILLSLCRNNPTFVDMEDIKDEILYILTTGNMHEDDRYWALFEFIHAGFHLLDRNKFINIISKYIPIDNITIVDRDVEMCMDINESTEFFNYPWPPYYHFDINRCDLNNEREVKFHCSGLSYRFFSHTHNYYLYLALKSKLCSECTYGDNHAVNMFGLDIKTTGFWLP